MSSAGHVQDMIQRQRQNRAALKSKQAKFKQRKILNVKYKGSGLVVDDVDISAEEMEQIKQEIRAEARAYKIKKWTRISIVTTIIFGGICYVAVYYLTGDYF